MSNTNTEALLQTYLLLREELALLAQDDPSEFTTFMIESLQGLMRPVTKAVMAAVLSSETVPRTIHEGREFSFWLSPSHGIETVEVHS